MDATISTTLPTNITTQCYGLCYNDANCGYAAACITFAEAHTAAVAYGFGNATADLLTDVSATDLTSGIESIQLVTRSRRSLEQTAAVSRQLQTVATATYSVSVTVPEAASGSLVSALSSVDATSFAAAMTAAIDVSGIAGCESGCATEVTGVDTSSITVALLDADGNVVQAAVSAADFLSGISYSTAAPDTDSTSAAAVKVGASLVAVAAAFFSLF
jgi:hypothetical protein